MTQCCAESSVVRLGESGSIDSRRDIVVSAGKNLLEPVGLCRSHLWDRALRFPDANALSLSFRQNSSHLLTRRVRALIEALCGRRPDVGRP